MIFDCKKGDKVRVPKDGTLLDATVTYVETMKGFRKSYTYDLVHVIIDKEELAFPIWMLQAPAKKLKEKSDVQT